MKDEYAIEVKNVTKHFLLPHERSGTLKSKVLRPVRKHRTNERQLALNQVSLQVRKGEFLGIVGKNGSGKSTLLKCLAGVYVPDSGSIESVGTIAPFIELGVGFNPELSGQDNIFLNGAMLGFSRKQVEAMYDDIVEFSELERFIDQKLKNYSSGMQVRLAFSIAIQAKGDILLLDEVLAVGDYAFQQKCFDYFSQLKQEKRTIVLVSHNMSAIEEFCDRAILLENGTVKKVGSPNEVANQYVLSNVTKEKTKSSTQKNQKMHLGEGIENLTVDLVSATSLSSADVLEFKVTYKLSSKMDVDLGIAITQQNKSIVEHNTDGVVLKNMPHKAHTILYTYPLELLNPGHYFINIAVFKKGDYKSLLGFNSESESFIITGEPSGGILTKRGTWVTESK